MTPDINALATIIITIVSLGVLIASLIMLRQNKEQG